MDEVVEIPALPWRGDNSMATSYARYAGGATNILVASARTGATSVHAGAHGTGAHMREQAGLGQQVGPVHRVGVQISS